MAITFNAADRVGAIGGYIGGISTLLGNTGIGNLFNGNAGCGYGYGGYGNHGVSRDAFDLSMNLMASERNNAILASELDAEKKMVEVFTAANEHTNKVRDELLQEIRGIEHKVEEGFAAQAVINCKQSSAIDLLKAQVHQLYKMTKLGILPENIWPEAEDPTP